MSYLSTVNALNRAHNLIKSVLYAQFSHDQMPSSNWVEDAKETLQKDENLVKFPRLGMPEFTFDMYIGKDGVPVVHVQTPEDGPEDVNGPICRIYLNDDEIHSNPAYCLCGEPACMDGECETCLETRRYIMRLRISDEQLP